MEAEDPINWTKTVGTGETARGDKGRKTVAVRQQSSHGRGYVTEWDEDKKNGGKQATPFKGLLAVMTHESPLT
jgi:hypothetical protein